MIRHFMFALAVGTAQPAFAGDARLLTRMYAADEVVRVEGRAGVQATISFGENEHIENVAIGDSSSWQVTPNKRANLLFVKPLSARARTNLTVVTDTRSYYFDLVASPTANALYLLRFTYPDEPKKGAGKTGTALAMTDVEAQAASGAVIPVQPAALDPSKLNFGWKQRGSSKLLPSRIYDDGASTFINWAVGRPVPAVLIRNEKGAEGPVNFAIRDDVMIIEGVPPLIVLRSGKDSAILEYHRSAAAAATASRQTASHSAPAFATAAPAVQQRAQ
jgi:type IV secretion system protein VirB9